MNAMDVIRRHLLKAEQDREFHRQRRKRSDFEALVAALKVTWLKDLMREIEATTR